MYIDEVTLVFDDFKFKCCVGLNGFSNNKQEGDKKTPKGKFALGYLYFRDDRKKKPKTNLKTILILLLAKLNESY